MSDYSWRIEDMDEVAAIIRSLAREDIETSILVGRTDAGWRGSVINIGDENSVYSPPDLVDKCFMTMCSSSIFVHGHNHPVENGRFKNAPSNAPFYNRPSPACPSGQDLRFTYWLHGYLKGLDRTLVDAVTVTHDPPTFTSLRHIEGGGWPDYILRETRYPSWMYGEVMTNGIWRPRS